MNTNIIITFMGIMYNMILRPLLIKAISDPDEEWDDLVWLFATVFSVIVRIPIPFMNPKQNQSDHFIYDRSLAGPVKEV